MTLPTTRIFRFAVAFAVTTTAFALIPSFAEPGRPPVSVEFTYNPEESAATNYRNLRWHVKHACEQQGPRSVQYMAKEKACVEGMTNMVVAQLARPDVNVAHAAATGVTGRRELAAQ
ncbi:MAG TPA: hypothetical protein VFV70_16180 [Hyphomonadaceae bacterium]|nr:hypothetical protein [Hyphomonadaceae bacterium]